MKYILVLLLLISSVGYGQTTYYIRADSTRLQKVGSNNEFILENITRSRTGAYLKNTWNGRTGFFYAVDSAYISGSDLILVRGGGTQNITVSGLGGGTIGGSIALNEVAFGSGANAIQGLGLNTGALKVLSQTSSGTPAWTDPAGFVNVKLGSRILKGTGDSLELATTSPTIIPNYNEQSSYITNLAWVQQTSNYTFGWRDGSNSFYINDTLFLVGGLDEILTTSTDSIHYSTDLGITWGAYSKKFPYAFANATSVKARYPGDWNYIFGIAAINSNTRTVTRFKDFTQFYTMTTTAEWGDQYLYGADVDDDGNLYLVGGQTDNQDTLTATKDVWYSTVQSGGANWTQVQTDVQKIGGCLINQVRYRDGYLYVLNSGSKMNSSGVSSLSSLTMKIPITQIRDSTKWVYVDNAPSGVGGTLFTSSVVFKGMIWQGFGNIPGTGNQNGIAYLDRNDKWHLYYSGLGIDSTAAITTAHATDFVIARGHLIKTIGNGSQEVLRLSDTTFSTPGIFRQSVKVANNVYASETINGQSAVWGRGVVASTTSNDQIIRTATEAFNPYYRQSFTSGHLWGGLTTSNSTINTPIAVATGNQMTLSPLGTLTIGASTSTVGTRLYNYGNAHFDGNNTDGALTWSHNGSTPTGQLTGVSGQAWVQAFTGIDLRLGANNATPTVVITTTGLQTGSTGTATHPLHVVGLSKFATGNQAAGKLLMSDANGVSDWAATFTGQQYVFGATGSGTAPTLTINRGANFFGNAVSHAIGFGDASVIGVMTYSSGHPWYGAAAGSYMKIFGENQAPIVVVTGTAVNIGSNAAPAASAMLDVNSTTKGFLPPRMTAAQAGAIASPAEGLIVYVTDTDATFTTKGWWGWNGAAWQQF